MVYYVQPFVTHLLISEAGIRLLAKGEDLPQENAEGPDIGLR